MSMALNPDQLVMGTANEQGLWLGTLAAAAPTDHTAAWGTGWTPLGYASEDGPTFSTGVDSEEIRGWQSLGVLRTIITGRTLTVQFQLMQWNLQNLALYWDVPMGTPAAGPFELNLKAGVPQQYKLGVDVRDGGNYLRFYFPRVQLSDAGDMQFQRSAASLLDVTFAVQEDPTIGFGTLFGDIPAMGAQGFSAAAPASAQSAPASGGAGGGGKTSLTVE